MPVFQPAAEIPGGIWVLTIFNRKELSITFSAAEQDRIRSLLTQNGIPSSVKVVNRNSPSVLSDTRARTGTAGQNLQTAYEYIVYVHKKDYEKAAELCGVGKIR